MNKVKIDGETFVLTTADMDRNDTPVIAISGLYPHGILNRSQQRLLLKFLLSKIDTTIDIESYKKRTKGQKYMVVFKKI